MIFFGILFAVFISIIWLAVKAGREAADAKEREAQTAFLYSLIREIAVSAKLENALQVIAERVGEMFHCNLVLFVAENGVLHQIAQYPSSIKMDESDSAKALWAFQNNQSAGCRTSFFSGSEWLFLPLEVEGHPVGILSLALKQNEEIISAKQEGFLEAAAAQLGIVIERARHLKVIEEARFANEARKLETTLLSCVSHDFRTPISSILGASTSLLNEEVLYNSASQKELLLTIRDEAERLNRFVMNLLDMMKLKSGLKLNQEWVDFQDLLGSSISRLTNLLENRRVVIDIPPDLPMLFVDFVLFDHVLLNLLDNAVKYSSEGSYITISARKGINSVQIEIQDEGIGVPVTELDLIFEEFYRVKRTSSISGTGLGLSICRGIVQAHGGRIFITSPDSGKGTSVILEISSADQNPAIMDDPDRTEEQMVTGSIFSERLRLSS